MAIRMNERELTAETDQGTVHLTPKEFDILSYLMKNRNRCVTAEEIYTAVWGAEPFNCRMIIAVHVCHIREKIENNPSHPEILKRIWGKGYIFSDH